MANPVGRPPIFKKPSLEEVEDAIYDTIDGLKDGKTLNQIAEPIVNTALDAGLASVPEAKVLEPIIIPSVDKALFSVTNVITSDFLPLAEKYLVELSIHEINSIRMHTQELEQKVKDFIKEKLHINVFSAHIVDITNSIKI